MDTRQANIWLINYVFDLKPSTKRQNLDIYQTESIYRRQIQMIISVFNRLENIVGKGENAGYQHCLLFSQCFQTSSFTDSVNVANVF